MPVAPVPPAALRANADTPLFKLPLETGTTLVYLYV
jgi:hypothetical protein